MTVRTDGKVPSDRLAWWREARFGMFIHWGLYSIPAGVWKGVEMPGIAEWIMGHFKIPFDEYRKLVDQFNPVNFDAAVIARLAKDAGMKYLVVGAKHHDGFAMFDSKADAYNIVAATPYRRDPMKDLAKACAAEGIVFCVYYSQDLDWAHPDGGGNTWDFDPAKKNFERYMEEKCKPQLRELLTQYGSIGLIWFDMAANITAEQSRSIRDLVHSIQPDCLVSGRVGHNMGDYGSLGDNQIPLGKLQGNWEVPATLNRTWGYKTSDNHWKSADQIILTLVDLAAKGTNYLLNIGPDGTGKVPEPSVRVLLETGAWLKVNGEAIYGTQPSPFPCEFSWGRITTRPGKVYFIFTKGQAGVFTIPGIKSQVRRARLLGEGDRVIPFRQSQNACLGSHALELTLPSCAEGCPPFTVACDIDGTLAVDETITQQGDGSVRLFAHMADLHLSGKASGRKDRTYAGAIAAAAAESVNDFGMADRMHVDVGGLTRNWFETEDRMSWAFLVTAPGTFRVSLHTVAAKYESWMGGHRVAVVCDDQSLDKTVTSDRRVESHRTLHFEEAVTEMGRLSLSRPGRYTLNLNASEINPDVKNGLCVSEVVLEMVPNGG